MWGAIVNAPERWLNVYDQSGGHTRCELSFRDAIRRAVEMHIAEGVDELLEVGTVWGGSALIRASYITEVIESSPEGRAMMHEIDALLARERRDHEPPDWEKPSYD